MKLHPVCPRRALALAAVLLCSRTAGEPQADGGSKEWRIVNAEPIEVAWRVRTLQFFSDDDCMRPLHAEPNHTGTAFASAAVDMTGADYAFHLRSPRGWESEDFCAAGLCHLGFRWDTGSRSVRCVLLYQGEEGLHAGAITLQRRRGEEWEDAATWSQVEPGKAKLALACPPTPGIRNGRVSDCQQTEQRSVVCSVECEEGYGTVEPSLRCVHGAWYMPECLALGSLIRLVARAPELIKPYWVVLDAALYGSPDCTDALHMEGVAISSGEYVIKYASYHPKHAWDSDASTSWASSGPCSPGSCYFGFRFRQLPSTPVRCVRIEHPAGAQYQATSVSVEVLGKSGWEPLPDVVVQLLPEKNAEL